MVTTQLMQDARHELNFRSRGREERIARLQAAGVPLEREALAAWLAAETVKQQEAEGYLFAFDVIRRKTGAMGQELKVDLALPHTHRIGITIVAAKPESISRSWYRHASAEEVEECECLECTGSDEPDTFISRAWGHLGNALFPRDCFEFDTEEEAVADARARMVADGWFATYAEAVAAGKEALASDNRVRPSQIED